MSVPSIVGNGSPHPLPPLGPRGREQREDMDLQEYQAMPSLKLGNSCQGKRYGTEKAGGTAHPWRTNHTCRVTLLQPARRAALLGQPFSFRPHWGGGGVALLRVRGWGTQFGRLDRKAWHAVYSEGWNMEDGRIYPGFSSIFSLSLWCIVSA